MLSKSFNHGLQMQHTKFNFCTTKIDRCINLISKFRIPVSFIESLDKKLK